MSKKIIVPLILLLSLILLTGCWDRIEINDLAFVSGSAFDKEKEHYRVTVQFPLVSQLGGSGGGGGGGTGGEKSWFLDSSTGTTILEAYQEQQKSISRKLYFAHRQVVLIGEEMAQSGIAPILDIVARMPENRLTAFVIITKGPARNILNAEATVERIPAEMLRELTISFMENTRMVKHVIDYMRSEGIDMAIPAAELVKTNPGPEGEAKTSIKISSLAVFNKNKLAGFLTEEETKGALWAMGKTTILPTIDVPAPKGKGGKIAVQFQERDVSIEPVMAGENITMKIRIKAVGSVIENESAFVLSNEHNLILLEQAVNKELKSIIEKSIKALQEKYHSDPIGFGDTIYRSDPKKWHKLRKEWGRKYPEVEVQVNPLLHIEHTGSIIQPMEREAEWDK
jgi:spore germination protein KC